MFTEFHMLLGLGFCDIMYSYELIYTKVLDERVDANGAITYA